MQKAPPQFCKGSKFDQFDIISALCSEIPSWVLAPIWDQSEHILWQNDYTRSQHTPAPHSAKLIIELIGHREQSNLTSLVDDSTEMPRAIESSSMQELIFPPRLPQAAFMHWKF